MPHSQFFRADVGISVLNGRGEVLALERYERPGAWQLPLGGLDAGEEPVDAVRWGPPANRARPRYRYCVRGAV
jgi:8-oxo-dGTP pyrophosphatase MutT (NUDIX family)